jgi:tripartite-type tricarboxylate transporter receptor subunit TctC
LISTKFVEKYPNTTIVPYKSPAEAITGLLSGDIDFAVGYVGDQENWSEGKRPVHILGVTGTQSINGHPTLTSLGFSKMLEESNNPNQFFVPATWSDDKYAEVRGILMKASLGAGVRKAYANNYCKSLDQMPDKDLPKWFNNQKQHWKSLSNGVKVN